jgi:hypothetical protein
MNRKEFLKSAMSGVFALTAAPLIGCNKNDDALQPHYPKQSSYSGKSVRFGLSTDVHQDFYPDRENKIKTFTQAMNEAEVDFIIDLGDFTFPKPANDLFLQNWKLFNGPCYNVIGNHDCEYSDKATWMRYVGFPTVNGRQTGYYSFDVNDFHFVVLDLNFGMKDGVLQAYEKNNGGGYYPSCYIDPEQLAWLRSDLAATGKRTILFSHQIMPRNAQNFNELNAVIVEANTPDRKVIAAFSGHYHRNLDEVVDSVRHITLNSMSGHYISNTFVNESIYPIYGNEIMTKYSIMKHQIPYNLPLYAIIELDPVKKKINITGTATPDNFVGKTPQEFGLGAHITSYIPDTTYDYV